MPQLDLVGVAEIAARARVTKDAVHKWRARHGDFPPPEQMLAGGPVWQWANVAAWLANRSDRHAAV